MIAGKKVVVVMPAFNAEKTIAQTWREVVEQEIVDLVIVVDDRSHDSTVDRARTLPDVIVHEHSENRGYGGNQKTCYSLALENGADVVIMVHADYQYTPKLIPAMAGLVTSNLYQCVLGSRILGGGAVKGRMPWWRYIANRFLTAADNLLIGSKLSEFHTGYRAFSRDLLASLPLAANSDDFVFDNQMLAQAIWMGFQIGEVSCPTRYAPENSSINFRRSVKYGFGCLATAMMYRLCKWKIARSPLFPAELMDRVAAPAP